MSLCTQNNFFLKVATDMFSALAYHYGFRIMTPLGFRLVPYKPTFHSIENKESFYSVNRREYLDLL